MPSQIDSAILRLLSLSGSTTSVTPHGGSGFSSTFRLSTKSSDGKVKLYFVKTGKGKDSGTMFAGEHASLNAINHAVPSLCPRSYAHGALSDTKDGYFLVTDFLDISSPKPGNGASSFKAGSGFSLAQKLVKLHTTPAPIPEGHDGPVFGFPLPTCCGNTVQSNTYTTSWSEFFSTHRLVAALHAGAKKHGVDESLSELVERTVSIVVPALLADNHLTTPTGGKIIPVVVHGDLWSGNHGRGRIDDKAMEEVVFDPSSSYAHSEFEFGIMKMFGGFGQAFEREYFDSKPGGKDWPIEEWEDRVRLYELYHHLNHYVLFGGGYKSGAKGIMRELISKYGK